jgi:hypothetical protein
MKRTILAASLAALTLAYGVAQADAVMSGVQNPGNFPEVAQGTSKWVADRNASGFTGIPNPGTFPNVPQTGVADVPHGDDEILSGEQNPGNFPNAPRVAHDYNNAPAAGTPSASQGSTRSGS